jgi:N-acylneuraminate cytidylyltransferase/CMP-N,N'-diacetyllegionaminic acid synthase
LCTVCARGGSKGVPDKNIRPLLGRPMIAHTIAQAKASRLFELVAVSSDSGKILEAAAQAGADMLIERPAHLADDAAAKLPAIRHAVAEVERRLDKRFKILADLDATSPLRTLEDIRGAVELVESGAADNVLSATEARHSPYYTVFELDASGAPVVSKTLEKPLVRRQDSPPCYTGNASIYVWRRDPFMARPYLLDARTRLFLMPPERSIDVDSEFDFLLVEFLMQRARNAQLLVNKDLSINR